MKNGQADLKNKHSSKQRKIIVLQCHWKKKTRESEAAQQLSTCCDNAYRRTADNDRDTDQFYDRLQGFQVSQRMILEEKHGMPHFIRQPRHQKISKKAKNPITVNA
ncbi:hypothetical protein [Eubacterium sp. 1001713B170207_170306_E7]|uniref:hypothetical protein n=1 Tax=Eubacterium sp. 1001713B170207_170306_E7 TaxID=2787097 RepID=UPI0018981BB6|nr:hypothetical protein [Eubacterium sp. 1001713B170207_170306_E7]